MVSLKWSNRIITDIDHKHPANSIVTIVKLQKINVYDPCEDILTFASTKFT